VIPGKTPQKKQTMIYYKISKIYPKKLGQAADEIFRVAACPCSEFVASRGGCVGQVDAEKLAQRSSVAACTGYRLRSSLFVQDQGLAIGVIFPSGHPVRSDTPVLA
jgi:hypothetical protein